MDMSMGIVARGGADVGEAAPETDGMAGMDMGESDDMTGMAMDEPAESGMATATMAGMSGMAGDGWSWDGFTAFVLAWAVMMTAMMFPAAAPMILLFDRVASQRRASGTAFVPTWVFVTGYLLVWSAVGAGVWLLVQFGSELAGRLSDADRSAWAPIALGVTLVVGGLYQFSPLKAVCLRHCQSPAGFVMTHWRDGYRGAARMGLVHGLICLGCCWALFAVMVAAGVMSLAWMLLLTLVVFAEKVLPLGPRAPRAIGAAFLILGLLVAAGATGMPWLA